MNGSSYTVSIRKRDQLPIWRTQHDDSHGCPEDFSDAAMQFYLMITALFKLPLRQTTGSVVSLLSMAKLDWAVPYYTNFCQLQKRLAIQIMWRRAERPFNLLVDSIGAKFLGYGEWLVRKHGVQGRRQWRKMHQAMDTATEDIRAMDITPKQQ